MENNEEMVICQSCSMPIGGDMSVHKGTNADGSTSEEYCTYCYKDGQFTNNMTLEETIADSVNYAKDAGLTEEQMLEHARKVLPTLKRWRQA